MGSAVERFNRTIELYKEGKIDEVMEILRGITEDELPYANAQLNVGVILWERGDAQNAVKAWKNVLLKKGDNEKIYAEAQINLGWALQRDGKFDEAREIYEKIDRKFGKEQYARAQLNLGGIKFNLGDIDRAINIYKGIKSEDSKDYYIKAQSNLGNIFLEKKMLEDAKEAYLNVINLIKQDEIAELNNTKLYIEALLNLGVIFTRQKKINEAREYFNKINPENNSTIKGILYLRIFPNIEKIRGCSRLAAMLYYKNEDNPL